MRKCKITKDDKAIAYATAENERPALARVYIANGKIMACNGFLFAIREIVHEGNMSIKASLLKGLKNNLFKSTVWCKQTSKYTGFTITDAFLTRHEATLDISRPDSEIISWAERIEAQTKIPTEGRSLIWVDRALLEQALHALPRSGRFDTDEIEISIGKQTDVLTMKCNGTTVGLMPRHHPGVSK